MSRKLENPKWGTPSQSSATDPKTGRLLPNQPSKPKYGTTPTELERKKYDGLSFYYFKIFEQFRKHKGNPAELKKLKEVNWILGLPPKLAPSRRDPIPPTIDPYTPDVIGSSPADVGKYEDHMTGVI